MDEQARGLGPDAWLRWFWLWDVYFVVGFAGVGALVLVETGDQPMWRRIGALLTIAAMAAWYAGYGRRLIVTDEAETSPKGRVFAAGVVLTTTVSVAFSGTSSFVLFAACPLLFMSLPLRQAIPAVALVNVLPPLSMLLHDGPAVMFAVLGPTTAISIVFAIALGTWISRIVAQSEGRSALIRELEASREENARLSRDAGIAAERSRLAAEIHDTLAQGFTSLVTLVQAAESELDRDTEKARRHLTLAARTARENLTEARALVAGLMPSELGGTGSLDEAVRRQVARLTEETGVRATYRAEGETAGLPTALEVVLLRAVQEALTNVRKHARATEVSISLCVTESGASLRVRDDGVGFDVTGPSDGFGLRGMRSRAVRIGGELTVHSGASGTTVELEVPR